MSVRGFVISWLVASSLVLGAATAAAQYTPARFKGGDAPAPPPNSVGWTWEVADVAVDTSGRLGSWHSLYGTKGRAGFVQEAVVNWSFEPARDGDTPVESRVFVAACYRAAVLMSGPEGLAPTSVSAPPDVPSPTTMVPPAYPPNALGDGVVIVELRVEASGAVKDARVVRSAGGFDSAALDAARQWRFRPAQRGLAYVYLIFGFRQPVT